MGLFVLCVSLFETLREIGKEKLTAYNELTEKRRYEKFEFDSIEYVKFEGTEPAFRIETEEEFDPVMTNFLTQQDGWQHYETKTVQYEIPDGENYCFAIKYKNGTTLHRKFHESSPLTEKLLGYCDEAYEDDEYKADGTYEFGIEFRDGTKISSKDKAELKNAVADVTKAFCNAAVELDKMFNPMDSTDYNTAASNFRRLQEVCRLDENSTEEDFIKATEIVMSELFTSEEKEFNQSIYELLLFLLSTPEDGDILSATSADGFSFLQESDLGTDAFMVLPKHTDIDNQIVKNVNNARIRQGYRKAAIVTTGNNLSALNLPDIIIWDLKSLCTAYIKAFRKLIG